MTWIQRHFIFLVIYLTSIMIFLRKTVLYVVFLSSVAASGTLRTSTTAATTTTSAMPEQPQKEGCPHAKLFHAWSQAHDKEYDSEESKVVRMKIWMENNRKCPRKRSRERTPLFVLVVGSFSSEIPIAAGVVDSEYPRVVSDPSYRTDV
jgi:hypothetical protein